MIEEKNELVCECRTRFQIPNEIFTSVVLQAIRDLLGDRFKTIKLREIFLGIYPYLIEKEEINSSELFRQLPPEVVHQWVKTPQTLSYYLRELAKLGIVEKVEGKKATFKVDGKRMQKIQPIDQVLYNEGFRDQLELYYPQIFKIFCVIARFFRTIYTGESEERVVKLTRGLIEAASRLAGDYIIQKGVLKRQCSECFYPLFDPFETSACPPVQQQPFVQAPFEKPEQHENQMELKEIPVVTVPKNIPNSNTRSDQPPMPLCREEGPLSAQIIQFIAHSDDGFTRGQIQAYFQELNYPEIDINEAIIQLINKGALYQRDSGRYKVL